MVICKGKYTDGSIFLSTHYCVWPKCRYVASFSCCYCVFLCSVVCSSLFYCDPSISIKEEFYSAVQFVVCAYKNILCDLESCCALLTEDAGEKGGGG